MELSCLNIEQTTGRTYLGEMIRSQMLHILNLRCQLDTHIEMLNKQLEIMSLEFREV